LLLFARVVVWLRTAENSPSRSTAVLFLKAYFNQKRIKNEKNFVSFSKIFSALFYDNISTGKKQGRKCNKNEFLSKSFLNKLIPLSDTFLFEEEIIKYNRRRP
jgi:hypothetical protein